MVDERDTVRERASKALDNLERELNPTAPSTVPPSNMLPDPVKEGAPVGRKPFRVTPDRTPQHQQPLGGQEGEAIQFGGQEGEAITDTHPHDIQQKLQFDPEARAVVNATVPGGEHLTAAIVEEKRRNFVAQPSPGVIHTSTSMPTKAQITHWKEKLKQAEAKGDFEAIERLKAKLAGTYQGSELQRQRKQAKSRKVPSQYDHNNQLLRKPNAQERKKSFLTSQGTELSRLHWTIQRDTRPLRNESVRIQGEAKVVDSLIHLQEEHSAHSITLDLDWTPGLHLDILDHPSIVTGEVHHTHAPVGIGLGVSLADANGPWLIMEKRLGHPTLTPKHSPPFEISQRLHDRDEAVQHGACWTLYRPRVSIIPRDSSIGLPTDPNVLQQQRTKTKNQPFTPKSWHLTPGESTVISWGQHRYRITIVESRYYTEKENCEPVLEEAHHQLEYTIMRMAPTAKDPQTLLQTDGPPLDTLNADALAKGIIADPPPDQTLREDGSPQ